MDAVKSFFAKYHAVPANDAGPQFDKASDAALLGWAEGDCKAWDRTLSGPDRKTLQNRMVEIRRELWTRIQAFGEIDFGNEPEARKPIRRAWHAVCMRIGFGGDEK